MGESIHSAQRLAEALKKNKKKKRAKMEHWQQRQLLQDIRYEKKQLTKFRSVANWNGVLSPILVRIETGWNKLKTLLSQAAVPQAAAASQAAASQAAAASSHHSTKQ